jgi:hypothetical protein
MEVTPFGVRAGLDLALYDSKSKGPRLMSRAFYSHQQVICGTITGPLTRYS